MKKDSFFSYGYTGMHHPCYTKLTLGNPLLLLKEISLDILPQLVVALLL